MNMAESDTTMSTEENGREDVAVGVAAIKDSTATNTNRELKEEDTMGMQMWNMYRSQRFTDMTIVCKGNIWKVHKGVIAAQSSVFMARLSGRFQEAEASCIGLPEEDPILVECLIQFLYTGSYGFNTTDGPPFNFVKSQASWGSTNAKDHARMYILADKYNIPRLFAEAFTRYEKHIVLSPESNAAYLEFLQSIPIIYTDCPSMGSYNLRPLVEDFFCDRYREIERVARVDKELKMTRDQIIVDFPDFASRVLLKLVQKPMMLPVCAICAENEDDNLDGSGIVRVKPCSITDCREYAFYVEH